LLPWQSPRLAPDHPGRVTLRPSASDDESEFLALAASVDPRLGFRLEGYSPGLLLMDGAWRGHERWAITSDMLDVAPVDPHPTLPAR
jgi:hypothetical protein